MLPNLILIITISTLLTASTSATCYSERCCNINPCTQSYCSSKTSQTWISTQNFANYGYTKLVLSNSSCLPCSYNCQSCSAQTSCTTCASGFYMSSGSCLLCSYMCSSCVVVNSITKCSACSGATYLDTTTVSCKNCPTGASACSSSTVVSQCQTGYYLTQNSMFCLSCPANCSSCPSSNTLCSACATGYYLNASLCYPCSLPNCTSCSYSTKQVCLACSTAFFLSSGTCKACPNNCNKCSSATTCTTCAQNYYLNAGTCTSSALSIDNCNSFSSASSCATCLSNYYLNSSLCFPCSLLCTACYNIHSGACTACASNAFLFNQMCLPSNYLSNSQYQLYYSLPSASAHLTVGSQDCNHYLFSGTTLSLALTNLAASTVTVTWKVYSIGGAATYTAIWTNSATTLATTYNTSASQYQAYPLCPNNASALYHLSQASQNVSTVKITNTLSFSSTSTLALQEVLVVVTSCNSLCIECSSVACTQCQMSNLYTQDAYCVYSCSSGYYIYINSSNPLNANTCLQQCPLGTYTLASNLTCVSCQSPCLSCLNDHFCLSCIDNYYLTAANTCQQTCPYQYFAQNTTKTCQKCSGRCNDCLDTLRCLSCTTGFYYPNNHSCLDNCYTALTGLYANLSTLTCQPCASNCLNCIATATYCTACTPSAFFYNHTCLPACPYAYYSDNSSLCQPCQYPCQACTVSPSNCTACTDRYLLTNTCLTDCPNGYFEDNSALTCLPCNSACSQCAESASNCLQCNANFFLFNSSCLSACPATFFGNTSTQVCQACVGYCYTCTDTTHCTACNTNFLLNNSCITASNCPTDHYADITQLTCLPCTAPCATCQYSATHCTSCDPASALPLLQNSTCLATCSSTATYAGTLNAGKACLPCLAPCLTCTNSSNCLSCLPGYMLSGGSCSTSCAPAYYFNSSTTSCSACSSGCLACLNALFCEACQSAYFTLQLNDTANKCVTSCGASMYASSVGSTCKSCLYPCANCTSPVDCTSCTTGALYQNRCLSTCPDTTYLNPASSTCDPCLPNCLTCAQTPTHCITCSSNYYLNTLDNSCNLACPNNTYPENVTQMCLQCPSACSACTNSTYCLACIPNRTYLYPSTHACLSACPLSSFANTSTSTCDPCAAKCLTCSASPSNCLSCNANYYLIQLSVTTYDCVSSCPQGYYQQSQNCQACVFPCSTCASATACVTCVTGTYFYTNTSSCLLACPSNTFLDPNAQTCTLCTSPCASCRSATYCLSCSTSLYLLNGLCLASCPPQYYSDSTQICTQCSGLCKTCTSKFYCLSCLTGYLSNGYCYSSCPPGTFANLNISACQPCLAPCLECTFSTSYCTHCTGALVVFQGNCSSTCPNGTYLASGVCLACQFPCINCLSSLTCSECLGGYLLYNSLTCINYTLFCPNGLYKKDSKYCIPRAQCPSNYNTDPDLRTCSATCSPTKYTQPNNQSCVYSCESNQYAGVGMICQNSSVTPPISLMGMTAVTFVQSNIMNIAVSFNETVIWLNSTNPYTLSSPSTLTPTTSRLLYPDTLNYSLVSGDPTSLILRVAQLPSSAQLQLPASNLVSANTNYPLQTPNISITLPPFVTYDYSTIYQGQLTSQFGYGLGWFILLLSLIYLFQNRISHLYTLWDTVQLLYVVILLDIQYPPALNEFLRGLNTTLFLSFPNIFSQTSARTASASPFYAYTHDNNFLRNAGPSLTLGIIVIIIYCLFKGLAELAKRVERVRNCLDEYPKFKRFLYQTLLRFRWHYVSDVFFLTYISVFLFGVAQLLNVSLNPGRFVSNALCAITLLIYLIFPIFAGVKLHRHFPNISKGKHSQNLRCFYRGIDKTSQFGVFLIMIRYFRKLIYAVVIGVFSLKPMFALPILMFCSVLMALFIFLKLPFKKRLSNIVEIINQFCIAILFLCMAIINFNNQQNFTGFNIALGYVCTGLLIFILLMLVFEVFCRSLFHLKSQQEIRKEKDLKLQDLSESEIRRKAGQFFDYMFPRIRKEFGFGEQSDEEQSYKYEQGDSQNSQNNLRREEEWGIHDQESQSDEFRHYGSESEEPTQAKLKAPQYLVRCVKQIK